MLGHQLPLPLLRLAIQIKLKSYLLMKISFFLLTYLILKQPPKTALHDSKLL